MKFYSGSLVSSELFGAMRRAHRRRVGGYEVYSGPGGAKMFVACGSLR